MEKKILIECQYAEIPKRFTSWRTRDMMRRISSAPQLLLKNALTYILKDTNNQARPRNRPRTAAVGYQSMLLENEDISEWRTDPSLDLYLQPLSTLISNACTPTNIRHRYNQGHVDPNVGKGKPLKGSTHPSILVPNHQIQ